MCGEGIHTSPGSSCPPPRICGEGTGANSESSCLPKTGIRKYGKERVKKFCFFTRSFLREAYGERRDSEGTRSVLEPVSMAHDSQHDS